VSKVPCLGSLLSSFQELMLLGFWISNHLTWDLSSVKHKAERIEPKSDEELPEEKRGLHPKVKFPVSHPWLQAFKNARRRTCSQEEN
jgi:hypothetical protein